MKKNNKGFTLAELLIVVAIIAVLVAIAIPVFTTQLEKSREATDLANVRSAYAEQMTYLLTWDGTSTINDIQVPAQQTQDNWQSISSTATTATIAAGKTSTDGAVSVPFHTKGGTTPYYTVKVDTTNMKVTVE
ncbi:MAG: prepilin-type N-terminal cleavage/methylation domain-containing protein [Oscillospiraceae bacterium]|nr:prepilin-type N-terminal cleavage/methylation domain-containing protein [Oscillospiraceae bacterium]